MYNNCKTIEYLYDLRRSNPCMQYPIFGLHILLLKAHKPQRIHGINDLRTEATKFIAAIP